jgi:glycosyltransferase involved in cell wall biosynthesis
MKIAIVAPGSVPPIVGGAEKLWWGLTDHINQLTGHDAELVKLPSPENNFAELMASYRQFSELDLSRFDRIITTKYPAWMVCHPHQTLYMQHKLRGLYDTYHFCKKPEHLDLTALNKAPDALRDLINTIKLFEPGREVLPQFWQQLHEAMAVAPEWFEFPGPLARKLVHFLDSIALQSKYIKSYFAISKNVAGRTGYFPATIKPDVIYHPSDLPVFKNTGNEYIFTISRLEEPKRVGLLIEAFMQTSAEVEFRIAGSGPQEQTLKALAADDTRIRFLGRISDAETIEQYASAVFVPFIPYDEDYGLITIEAMQSARAVLTTTDAGGPNEFVDHYETGLSVAPELASLTEAINELLADREKTRLMGKQAFVRVQGITWQNTVNALLKDCNTESQTSAIPQLTGQAALPLAARTNAPQRQKWLVTVTFPVWPPRGGGQSRVFNFYREIAKLHDVTILCLTEASDRFKCQLIAPGLTEIRVPRSYELHHHDVRLHEELAVSAGDISFIEYFQTAPQYLEQLKQLSAESDVVIASHPYTFRAIRHVYRGSVWYEAHNVEYDMKAAVLPMTGSGRHWLEIVRNAEADCYKEAARVMVCSDDDKQRLEALYGEASGLISVVPNGVVIHSSFETLQARKAHIRQRLGLHSHFTALFMGSWHGPNIEAVEWIVANASRLGDIQFMLVGSVCLHAVCKYPPANVHNLGLLDEDHKNLLVEAAHVAINPIVSGSGTNLKMLDYAAAGIPIVTTLFGNRGLPFKHQNSALIANLDDFPSVLREQSQKQTRKDELDLTSNAYDLALGHDYIRIAKLFFRNLLKK